MRARGRAGFRVRVRVKVAGGVGHCHVHVVHPSHALGDEHLVRGRGRGRGRLGLGLGLGLGIGIGFVAPADPWPGTCNPGSARSARPLFRVGAGVRARARVIGP